MVLFCLLIKTHAWQKGNIISDGNARLNFSTFVSITTIYSLRIVLVIKKSVALVVRCLG